jgi:DNA-binding NarL/FixJ family response regulator
MSVTGSKLILVSQPEFIRGCLSHWLRACCSEFGLTATANLDAVHAGKAESLPAAIVIYVNVGRSTVEWIEQQIGLRNQYYKLVPIILITNEIDPDFVWNLPGREAVAAIIPSSDTTEVAAAALRLVLAGGYYMPQLVPNAALAAKDPAKATDHQTAAIAGSLLTARERAVLELLKTGKPNKVIAHELGMALSTVKVHVHNIIRKLKSHNRTEAVIAASTLTIPLPSAHSEVARTAGMKMSLTAGRNPIEQGSDAPSKRSRQLVRWAMPQGSWGGKRSSRSQRPLVSG